MNFKIMLSGLGILLLVGCVPPTVKPPKNDLGRAYELYNGLRIKNDYKKANEIATKVCNSNELVSPYGCFLAGWGYYNGKGVAKDYQKAFEYFNKGCEDKKIETKRYTNDDDTVLTKKSQLKYSQRACYMLAKMYEKGLGVPADYIKAFQVYQKAFIAKTRKITEKKRIEEEKPVKLSKTMQEKQKIQEGIKTPAKTKQEAEEDFDYQLMQFPVLESSLSFEEQKYTLKTNQILKEILIDGHFYKNNPLYIQEDGDMGFFVFNDYLLESKVDYFSDISDNILLDAKAKQIKEQQKLRTKSKIDTKLKVFIQKGDLLALKRDDRSSYQVFLNAIINKNSLLDMNKAITFYDYLIKESAKYKHNHPDNPIYQLVIVYAYGHLDIFAYMNKGIANEMLYASSKNPAYFRESLQAYGKACDLTYVLGCAFYKNLIDGLSNLP
ncbi:hypothetical protein BKH42_07470 [Helicobacter sp. 13S00482-2]|uniref:tetratricopeptide repeat protein n=1 Tax=Helicobacter sp. 13S00482-2 TaxID=1476200 RepID=UPI000BA7AB12|nr:tetratricopeptide repeat protein [Helicobacter sp. 13S00482-2]PAF53178.1 hypothetical protein BKH42_07470 [Helicobacter sp. 13S00482-2]